MLQKAQYEQKNSNVNLKNGFERFKDLSEIYQKFKIKLDKLNKKKYLVAVSGGPDSGFGCFYKSLFFKQKK